MDNAKKFILDRVAEDANGCWVWQKYLKPDGYGRTVFNGKSGYAHRIAYTAFVGPIQDGFDVDHKCWNRACCNPDHLRAIPAPDNRSLQRAALKTHCVHGHKLEGRNLINRPGGQRGCRECMNAAVRRYQKRKKSRAAAA